LPQGSLDSSHFGLVGKKDILGKVRIKWLTN
jgi:type IV secretory pathway protease TraF